MKIQATGNDNSSPFNRLPDEIVLDILNKLIDLKTLCICYVVCKRFSSIVVQVDTISYTSPPIFFGANDYAVDSCFHCNYFRAAVKSMNKFREVKSFCINLPFPAQEGYNCFLYKWKANFGNNEIDSFVILSPNSICYDTQDQQQVLNSKIKEHHIILKCLRDAFARFDMLFELINIFPLLEKVSITDSAKLGIVSFNSGGHITEIRKCLLSTDKSMYKKMKLLKSSFFRVSLGYIPLLEFPVSRYVMKGVALYLWKRDDLSDGYFSSINFNDNKDDFEDKVQQAAYIEAVNEIFNKHRGSIRKLRKRGSISINIGGNIDETIL